MILILYIASVLVLTSTYNLASLNRLINHVSTLARNIKLDRCELFKHGFYLLTICLCKTML